MVTGSFPTRARPGAGAFVRQFAFAIARAGHDCWVICPTSIFDRRFGDLPPRAEIQETSAATIRVLRPRFLSASIRDFVLFNTATLTQWGFNAAVRRGIRGLPRRADIIYGHFLYQGGRGAIAASSVFGVPAIVGVGEGKFWTIEPIGVNRARRELSAAAGFLAVSTPIKNALVRQIGIPAGKIRVFPNGVDSRLFFRRDRDAMCGKYGIPVDTFNVVFVGCFDDLKGPARLAEAVQGLSGLSLIFVGEGPVEFDASQTVFKGTLQHERVPEILSACDLFVLPTAEEGSCNALIEAMACGLPIVTSDGEYTADLVDDTVAIRLDPYDVGGIRNAILELKKDVTRRSAMSEAALNRAAILDIDARARRVTDWMKTVVSAGEIP